MARILAAGDLGSNTAHMLVAGTDGELVTRIDNCSEWIPLGEVVTREGRIPSDIQDELVMAVREFRRVATQKKAESLYVFATEAMRVATNHEQVLRRIRQETGISVDLISPAQESAFSWRGVQLDCGDVGADILFEVGGGSVQMASLQGGQIIRQESLPLGSGRVIATCHLAHPCPSEALESAKGYIDRVLHGCNLHGPCRLAVLSGGVGRGLWRALHPDGEKLLFAKELDYLSWSTARLSVNRIVARYGVKPKRAGTLLAGSLVYLALLKKFEQDMVIVSEFGVREGAVLEMYDGKVTGCRV